MNISEIAMKTNISTETLRYYERIGIIPPVPRKANGIRSYDEKFIDWINLVQKLKDLGMSLEMIVNYFELAKLGDDTSSGRKALIQEIRENLLEKILHLQMTLQKIDYQLNNYDEVLLPETENTIYQWN